MTHDDSARPLPILPYAEALARVAHELSDRQPARLSPSGLRPAAVAIVMLDIDSQAHVILTRRSPKLRAYSGQVALPGGVRDAGDRTAADTAMREANEEIGLQPEHVHILGQLDDQPTLSGFIITPVVAFMDHMPVYQPNQDEVACVFEAPLALFADPARAEPRGERRVGQLSYPLRAYRHGEHTITGATAHILELLCGLAKV